MVMNNNGDSVMFVIVPKSAPVAKRKTAWYPLPFLISSCVGSSAVCGVGVLKNIVGIASIMLCVIPMLIMNIAGIIVLFNAYSVVIVSMIIDKRFMCSPGISPVMSPVIVPVIIVINVVSMLVNFFCD